MHQGEERHYESKVLEGRGGVPGYFCVRVCQWGSDILTLYQTMFSYIFSNPILDKMQKIITLLQTFYSLGLFISVTVNCLYGKLYPFLDQNSDFYTLSYTA